MTRWNSGPGGRERAPAARDARGSSSSSNDSAHGAEPGPNQGLARCRECSATVAAETRFCPNCGARMQEVCFACGALSAAGARFCGECGADLIHGLETQVTLLEEKVAEGRQLLAEASYSKAIELLLPMTAARHPILARYAGDARELIGRAKAAKAEKEAEVKRAHDRACAARRRAEYHLALRLLEEIEPHFRTEAVEQALRELRPIVGQIDRLAAEITDRSAQRDAASLMAKVARLLELQPAHAAARGLAEQFRDFAQRRAGQALDRGEHDRAAEILALVPEMVATEETRQLRRRAGEFGWLQWDLFHAPAVDATLVDAARRLLEMAPRNQRFQDLHGRLSRLAARHADESLLPPVRWAAPPKQSSCGCPIEWLTGLGKVEISATADRVLLERFAGGFFAAFGLALQGLGKAAIAANFLGTRRGGLLGGARPGRSAWGLDLSLSGLKALRLDVRKQDDEIVVGACDWIEHRKPLGQASGPDERREILAETIGIFRKRGPARLERACASLPDMHWISRRVTVPPTSAEKLAEVMQHEARLQLASLPGDLAWAYHCLEPAGEAALRREHPVLLVAVKKAALEAPLEVLRSSKIKVDQVQVDWLALVNALVYLGHFPTRHSFQAAGVPATAAALDVGSETSTLVVHGPGQLDARLIRVGGYAFTRAVARAFGLPLADAEKLKRDPRSLDFLSRLHEAVRPVLEDLLRDLRGGLNHPPRDGGALCPSRLLAVGGGMRLHGLWRYLLWER